MGKITLSATVMVVFLFLIGATHLVAASGPTGTWRGTYEMHGTSSIEGTAFCGGETSGDMMICLKDGVGIVSRSTTAGSNNINNAPFDCMDPIMYSSLVDMGDVVADSNMKFTRFADYTDFSISGSAGAISGTFSGTSTYDSVIVLQTTSGSRNVVGAVNYVESASFSLSKTSDKGCWDFDITPTQVPIEDTGGKVDITNNDYFSLKSNVPKGTDLTKVPAEEAEALKRVSQKLQMKLYFTEMGRTLKMQTDLYDTCLKNHHNLTSQCTGVCNPADNCPHVVGRAVDVWCPGGSEYKYDPECQAMLTEAMAAEGFCRLNTEGWHFEWRSAGHVSSGCETYANAVYWDKKTDKFYDPAAGGNCKKWDYTPHVNACAEYKVPPSETASVKTKSGDVKVKRLDGTVAPLDSDAVPMGDAVQTGNGVAELGFGDDAIASIFPSTTVTVVNMGAQLNMLDISLGILKAMVTPNLDKQFMVKTPNAVTSVRGTEFMVDYADSKTTVYLHDGVMDVYPIPDESDDDMGAVELTAGHSMIVHGDGSVDVSVMDEQKWISLMSRFGTSMVEDKIPIESGCAIADDCPANNSCTVTQCLAGSCTYYIMGCELSGSCVQKGEQRTVNGVLSYCAVDTWNAALKNGEACTHDSECVDYVCDKGKCGEEGPLSGVIGIFEGIWRALMGLFGLH